MDKRRKSQSTCQGTITAPTNGRAEHSGVTKNKIHFSSFLVYALHLVAPDRRVALASTLLLHCRAKGCVQNYWHLVEKITVTLSRMSTNESDEIKISEDELFFLCTQ